MQKTRLGISVGLMGFITYFGCCFGGYIAAILLFGYILLVENNQCKEADHRPDERRRTK